jgi:hypothetical protein
MVKAVCRKADGRTPGIDSSEEGEESGLYSADDDNGASVVCQQLFWLMGS